MNDMINTALPDLSTANVEKIFEQTKPYQVLMMKYNCALREVQTKFEVLNSEFSVLYDYNPVESIKTRLKTPISIIGKLNRKGYPLTIESVRTHLNDVAGIRIICSFIEDIYSLSEMFLRQDDVTLLEIKDYIKHPKENGYRSLHLIVEIPIFLTETTENIRVEVQFRTIAMDFWASLEHKTQYKKNLPNSDIIYYELKSCADHIASIDQRMQHIHDFIKTNEKTKIY